MKIKSKRSEKDRTVGISRKSYEILLSSLEDDVQQRYKDTSEQEIVELELENDKISLSSETFSCDFIPERGKMIALAKIDLLNEWTSFRNQYKTKTEADKLFIELYKSGEYLKNIFQTFGKTSRGSLLRWNKVYSYDESWENLVPQYKYSGIQDYKTTLTDEQIGIFLKILLHPNQFSIGKAIKLTTLILKRKISVSDPENFNEEMQKIPQAITFRRYAKWFRKNNFDKWVLMREGEKSLRDKVEPFIKRDLTNISIGECKLSLSLRFRIRDFETKFN